MPFILYSYILAEIAAPFGASLVILSGVLFAGKLMKMIDMIFQLNISFVDFLRLVLYIAPNQLLFSIPMAGTLAVLIAFTRLSNDNEIVALKAAGLNIYSLLPPVIIFALTVALLSGFISTQLIPAGRIAMHSLFIKLASEKIDSGIQEKRFSEGTGNMVLYVDSINKTTKRWQGVYLSDISDTKNPTTIISQSGSITPHLEKMAISIELKNGTMHRSTKETTQTIEFDRYQVDIPIEPPKAIYQSTQKNQDKNRLNQSELLAQAKKAGPGTTMNRTYLVEYHLRIVFAVGTFILSILGLPLALRNKGGQRNIGIPMGLGCFILYFIAITIAKNVCATSSLPVGLVMWLPNIFFGGVTLLIFYITATEKWYAIKEKASSYKSVGNFWKK